MKFKLLEAEGSNVQLYGAGNVFLFILSQAWLSGESILCHRHRTDSSTHCCCFPGITSRSSCGKGRSQPEEAVRYSWEQDEPHGQGRDVSIGQVWPCMLCEWALLWPFALKSLCSSVACPFVFESSFLLAAGQWVLLASSAVPFFTVVPDSLFFCLWVSRCLELVLSMFFLCPLLQRAVCVEAHKYFIAALWPSEAKPHVSVVFFWTHGHLFITLG